MQVQSLGWEDLLEKEMETYSSILAWRILRTEEPDGLLSMGSQRDILRKGNQGPSVRCCLERTVNSTGCLELSQAGVLMGGGLGSP